MAEGRSREAWEHTSSILAMIANVNRTKSTSRKFTPLDFDPYRAEKKREAKRHPVETVDIAVLKAVFVDSQPKAPSVVEGAKSERRGT
jgi:hypothetical protein